MCICNGIGIGGIDVVFSNVGDLLLSGVVIYGDGIVFLGDRVWVKGNWVGVYCFCVIIKSSVVVVVCSSLII